MDRDFATAIAQDFGAAGLGLGAGGLIASRQARATTVTFSGWAFEPQVVEANVKVFMQQNPDSRSTTRRSICSSTTRRWWRCSTPARSPTPSMSATPISAPGWRPAGCSRSTGCPELDELNKDIFPFNREALFYKGKQYGTPYYGDIYVYMHDKKAARQGWR